MVSCSDSALSVCYGFVRLNCGDNSSRIQVKLALEIQDEGTLCFKPLLQVAAMLEEHVPTLLEARF